MTVAISFFSGAGGLDMGIQQAGFDIKLTVEIEKIYCETLMTNHPELNVVQGDIMTYSKDKIYEEAGLQPGQEIDLMFGGSPCQSFSTAGKRQAFTDARGQAMLKFAELVTEARPKVFLLENVRGLLSAALKHRPINQRGEDFPPLEPDEMPGSALSYLLGKIPDYEITLELVNAADYGVPQTRERVFIVGVRSDLHTRYRFPAKTHTPNGADGTSKWVTLGEVLNRLSVEQHHYVEYSLDRLKYMQMVPQGGGYWKDLPKDVIKQAMGGAYESGGGKMGFFRRLHVHKPSPTLLTSPMQKSTNLGHPYKDRPLSIEEYLAIQEFPVDYRMCGSLTQQYIQIGNAVPVRLAQVIGESIYDLIHQQELSPSLPAERKIAATAQRD